MASAAQTKKRYDITNFPVFSEFVFLLDSYRVQQYTELKWADKVVEDGKMGYWFRRDWEEVRKLLTKMARVPVELRYLLNWAKYQNILRFFGNIISTVMLLVFGLGIFFAFGGNRSLYTTFANIIVYFLPVVVAGLTLSFAGPPVIAGRIYRRLTAYRAKHLEQFEQWESQVKAVVQNLIASAAQQAKEGKLEEAPENLKRKVGLLEQVDGVYKALWRMIRGRRSSKSGEEDEFVFDLFKTDYRNVEVLQQPSLLRRHYKVRLVWSADPSMRYRSEKLPKGIIRKSE